MAEKNKDKGRNKIFNMENIFATMLGASSLKDWAQTEGGKVAVNKIAGKFFGFGPKDENIEENALNFYIKEILKLDVSNPQDKEKIIEVTNKFYDFIEYLKKEGFSIWWFRNVLVAGRAGDKDGEDQAAEIIARIMLGGTFPEMKKLAGHNLIHKTYKENISEGWEIVVGKGGQMSVLFDRSKFNNFIQPKIETAKADFKRVSIQTLKWFWGSVGALTALFFLFVLFSN